MHRLIKSPQTFVVIAIILLTMLRIILLPFSPPGFFLDESAGAAHAVAMLQHFTNAHGESWPLYSASLGGGYTTPVYLYPLVAWASVFGVSEVALRAFSLFTTFLAIAFISLAVRLWLGRVAALVAALVGLALPWGWLQGNIAWDPALVPLFVALALYGFSLLWHAKQRPYLLLGAVLLPSSLLLLAYLYPPCRVTAPLLFIAAYWALIAFKKIQLRHLLIVAGISAVFALPLLAFMLQPDSLARSRELSVFYERPLLQGAAQVIFNALLLINPVFLFIFGDPNLRHSTGFQGMLGIAAAAPLIALLFVFWKKKSTIRRQLTSDRFVIAVTGSIGIVASLLGSALTSEGQPHSLRAVAMWPFFVILITLGWIAIAHSAKTWLKAIAITLFVAGTLSYAIDFGFSYPSRAAASFDQPVREKILQGEQVTDYPALSLKYYELR